MQIFIYPINDHICNEPSWIFRIKSIFQYYKQTAESNSSDRNKKINTDMFFAFGIFTSLYDHSHLRCTMCIYHRSFMFIRGRIHHRFVQFTNRCVSFNIFISRMIARYDLDGLSFATSNANLKIWPTIKKV